MTDIAGSPSEGAGIWVRYLYAKQPDEFFSFSEESRRVRHMAVNRALLERILLRMSSAVLGLRAAQNRELPLSTARHDHHSGLPSAPMYQPAGFKTGADGLTLGEEPFELRHAYIVEMRPRFAKGPAAAAQMH